MRLELRFDRTKLIEKAEPQNSAKELYQLSMLSSCFRLITTRIPGFETLACTRPIRTFALFPTARMCTNFCHLVPVLIISNNSFNSESYLNSAEFRGAAFVLN